MAKRPNDEEIDAIKARLAELNGYIADLARTSEVLKFKLAPVWTKQHTLEDRIRATHPRVGFNRDGAEKRKPSFDGLLQLAIDHGRTKGEYRETESRLRAYQREAKTLWGILDKAKP